MPVEFNGNVNVNGSENPSLLGCISTPGGAVPESEGEDSHLQVRANAGQLRGGSMADAPSCSGGLKFVMNPGSTLMRWELEDDVSLDGYMNLVPG